MLAWQSQVTVREFSQYKEFRCEWLILQHFSSTRASLSLRDFVLASFIMEKSFKVLRHQGRSELLEILDSLRGRKCLVLEPSIMRLLSEVLFEGDQQLMEDNNVYQCDINSPSLSGAFESDVGYGLPDNICYLVRPNFTMMKTVSRHIRECAKSGERQRKMATFRQTHF